VAYKAGQWTEAYKNYEAGLEADKRVVELQANAAMASLKIGCPVQVRPRRCPTTPAPPVPWLLHSLTGCVALAVAPSTMAASLPHWMRSPGCGPQYHGCFTPSLDA
jgi:hypothetical protein